MRAVPIPDAALRRVRAAGAYADRVVIGEDDPTRDDVRPAEYLVRHSDLYPGRLSYSALVALDDSEREAVTRGHRLWLTLDGAEVPWSIEVADLDRPDQLPDLAKENAVLRQRLAEGGPYMLGRWTDLVVHADPCDCDEDNEDVGDRCMDASDWSYAVLADEGGFAPSLVLKLPRHPPEAAEDGTRLLADPIVLRGALDTIVRLTAERGALQARLDEATATIDSLNERLADVERRTGERSGGV